MTSAKQMSVVEGLLNISISALSPIGAWLMSPGDISMRAAIVGGVIGGLVATRQWLKESPFVKGETPDAPA